jgi:SAM-dependent methyltransferase
VVDAFHHFPRQEQVLAEVGQVLEPAGRLVIEEPDIDKLPVKCIAVGERLLGMRSHFRSAAELARLVATRFPHVHVEQGGRFAMWIVGERADSRFVQACQPPGRRLSSEATVADEAGSEKKSPSLRKSWPAKGA